MKELTSKAFSHFENATIKDIADTANVMQSLQILCQLKGVGPATASLILAVAFPSVVPFFADELFAWISLEREDQLEAFLKKIYPKDGKSMRVDKIIGIKYTEVEYKKLYAAVANLRRRLQSPGNNVSASDIEKAAYVVLQGSEVPLLKLPSLSENTGSRRRPAVDIDSSMTDHSKFSTEPTAKTSLKVDEKGGGTQRRSTRNSNRDESPPQLRSSKRRKMSSD